jgi:putative spermidine/putrescine transport system ATP-binding protein
VTAAGSAVDGGPLSEPVGAGHLTLVELTKRFPGFLAVDALDLDVKSGEFLTLLGPSGSGKTTTLMMIAGFVAPTAGEIFVDGRPVTAVPPDRRNIGVVFQHYALFPHMTVFDNVAFPLRMRRVGTAEIRRRVGDALGMVQLAGLEARMPRQLSGGQQQRVALARALVFRPTLLLMDEPLGALDKNLREQMQLELKRLHRSLGITVVYVTHDQAEALTMSDRIALMNHGRIEQLGDARELYECPVNPFVAEFLGESNMVAGRLERSADTRHGCVVTADGARLPVDSDAAIESGEVLLVVRPEKIVLEPDDGTSRGTGCRGIVTEVSYAGDATRYRVQVGAETTLTAKLHNRSGAFRAPLGASVRVAWDPGDVRLLRAPESVTSRREETRS